MEFLLRDGKTAWRSLLRRPGLTSTALLSLALGIGANSAIFSLLDAVVLKPLPIPSGERVFAIETSKNGQPTGGNPARLQDWRQQVPSFESGMALYTEELALTGIGDPRKIRALRTFGDPFATTGLAPQAGRAFTPDEIRGAGTPVAAISGPAQRLLFGGQSAVGRTISLDRRQYTIVATLPAESSFPSEIDFWIPAPANLNDGNRKAAYSLDLVRLKGGATRERAALELSTVQTNLARQYPDTDAAIRPQLRPLHEALTAEYRTPLLVILGVVAIVLFIACLNISCLLLARASERERESAIRAALGAGRTSLIRLYLVESALLAFLGGTLGLMVAAHLVELLKTALPVSVSRLETASLDWRVLGFAAVLTLLCALVFGLAPAWQASRVSLAPQMARAPRRPWLRSFLVVTEVAVSVTLLIGAGTLLESFLRLKRLPLGFQPGQVLTTSVDFAWSTPKPKLDTFQEQALEGLAAIPGVSVAGVTDRLPAQGGSQDRPFTISGRALPPELAKRPVGFRAVSEGYFRAVGVPLLSGTWLRPKGSVLVNEAFVKTYFPNQNPLGQQLVFDTSPPLEIVGIVGDVRREAVQTSQPPEVFVQLRDTYWPLLAFVVRAQGANPLLARQIHEVLRRVDPAVIPGPVRTLDQAVNRSFAEPRLYALGVGAFALLALLLAAIGIQGVMASDVATRTREIGIRMALGAQPAEARASVLSRGMKLVAAGSVLGLAGGAALSRVLESLPVAARANEPVVLTLAPLFLGLVALAACWIPARRAASVDPIQALRHD